MQRTDIAIVILLFLNIVIICFTKWFDRKFYPATPFYDKTAQGRFFYNATYDEPVNRFLLSKGGMLLFTLVLLAEIAVSIITEYAF